ncbi:hypothetical protein [Muribacter muris]|uniref:hypothetical protein n=1 Tax=Muribacter muris TaxID=67855 RepID=UPI001883198F|nr:hypothetical protein [Muribacter muris]MBF0826879.1 hypothetical protein [Muribacter muris]
MKRITILLLFCPLCVLADPFYVEEKVPQAASYEQNFANKPQKSTACRPQGQFDEVMIDVDFDTLRLVGLIKLSEHYKALFIDSERKLYDFSENQYLTLSDIQINHIDLKQVSYIDWRKSEDCQKPLIKTIKL